MARARRRLITALALLVAVFVLARVFLVGRYYVNGPSMEPTIHGAEQGGDHLLVRYGGAADLERFDLVAIRPAGGGEPRVKRVGALWGERIAVRDGDLWIDEALLPPEVPRPDPVLVFDEEHAELERWFRLGINWKRVDGGWALDATEVPRGAGAGLMFMRVGLKDHYLGPDGEIVIGHEIVHDGIVECEAARGDPPATLRLGLVDMGDTFEAVIEDLGGGRAAVRLLRRCSSERKALPQQQTLAEGEIAFGEGFHQLRFANIDNHLSVDVDGECVLAHSYESNSSFRPLDGAWTGSSPPTDRVFLGGECGRALFRKIRVLRDLHYTPRGEYGIGGPVVLGPDEIFVLGDNSRESRDGRDWGPTPLEQVFGRPLWVVWPPSRVHELIRPARR